MMVDDTCDGCGECIDSCPTDAISIEDGRAVIGEACIGCGNCVDACTRGSIAHVIGEPIGEGVLVVGEIVDGRPTDGTLSTIGRASSLGCAGPITSLLIDRGGGRDLDAVIGTVDRLHILVSRADRNDPRPLAEAIASFIGSTRRSIVLFPASSTSRDVAPRVAAMLGVGLTADCTSVGMEDGRLMQTRPAFGGDVMATIVSDSAPQMAVVTPGGGRAEGVRTTIVTEERVERIDDRVMTVSEEAMGLVSSLSGAEVVISVGNGVSDRGIALARRLADEVGGALGCSRAVVESGRLDRSHQVGQTGTFVTTGTYVAIGISGAVQHRVGISSSSRVIAVNIDPEAPIHGMADVSLTVDAEQLLSGVLGRLLDEDV